MDTGEGTEGDSPFDTLPGGVYLGSDHRSRFRANAEILSASKTLFGLFDTFYDLMLKS